MMGHILTTQVNGTHVSENKPLLDILRKEWGHQGIIMSDWFGTYSISEAINAGLNIEFPGPTRFRNKTLIDHLVTAHKIDERQIDSLVTCILAWVQKLARISPEHVYAKEKAEFTRWDAKAHDAALVRKIAAEGIVVLKNEQSVLPVRKGKVAVIGPNARAKVFTGGGSARLQPAWSTTPWQGLELGKPADVDLSYALGCSTSKFFPLLDEHFTTEDGTVGFDAYHYALTEDGLQAAQHIGHDKLLRSEVRFNNWTLPDLGSSWFTELKAVFTSPLTGEYEFEIIGTGKFWFYVDDRLVQEVTDYAVKGEAFYGNGTPTKAVRVAVKKGQVGHH
jgi:beta-glucosidase